MKQLEKHHKEIIRYIIVVLIMIHVVLMSKQAYELELVGKLTLQFAGVVASGYGVLTLVLKYIFHTEVSK